MDALACRDKGAYSSCNQDGTQAGVKHDSKEIPFAAAQ